MKRVEGFSKLEEQRLKKIYQEMEQNTDEKTKRLLAGAMVKALGYGGKKIVQNITGLANETVKLGYDQIVGNVSLDNERIRRKGGGRKKVTELYPDIEQKVLELVEADTKGDPETPLLWTSKSLQKIADALADIGYNVSVMPIADILRNNGYSLQVNKKSIEGGTSPERNQQFEHINQQIKQHQSENQPVISVDTKKKELVGPFKNGGKEYRPKGKPEETNVYDFIDKKKGKAIPYGVYDISQNDGWVSVGINHDTAQFAVNSIRNWWNSMGNKVYSNPKKLLITADGGGSNGSRVRLWKAELQKLSNELEIPITVCHFPPGTSKWNKIEHRMFSVISMNWRGKPLISHEVIVNLIASSKTKTGLKINCELDPSSYEKGIKVSNEELESINIEKHDFMGKWNYTIHPHN